MSFKSNGKPYARRGSNLPDGQWSHDRAPGEQSSVISRAVVNAGPSTKLVVENLHYEVSEKDLSHLFGKYGPITRGPSIRYDRSGRSTGSAFVTYSELEDALEAKKALHGALAKGQEMSIKFDSRPIGSGRPASSLLERIEKPPLLERLGGASTGRRGSAHSRGSGGVGPQRTNLRGNGRPARERSSIKKHLTADDLDKELDQYGAVKTDEQPAVQSDGPIAPTAVEEDVEMS